MWDKIKVFLIMLSIGFNVAFLVIWITHFVPERAKDSGRSTVGISQTAVPCPLYKKLDLNEKQGRKADSLLIEFRTSSNTIWKETGNLRGELIDLLAMSQPDTDAIGKKQDKMITSQKKMQALTISHILEMKQLLTPDQQKIFFKLMRGQGKCHFPDLMMKPASSNSEMPGSNQSQE